ncbi:MAG: hypothetical protein J6P45_09860 [Lachnospiraceae bacterium]|nr:hypothetical protein [Lachnospiraceae bacterium]
MKRSLVLILAGVMSAALFGGCTGNEPQAAQENPAESTEEESKSEEEKAEEKTAEKENEEGELDDSHKEHIDITGCDTFTDIVNRLGSGFGYANTKIGDTDVLLVSTGTYSDGGKEAAIDAEIFYYNDGKPESLGFVQCGGTAYPLAVKDDILYVGRGHGMCKYTCEDGKLFVAEEAEVEFSEDGSETYKFSVNGKVSGDGNEEAEKKFSELFLEAEEAEIIEFSKVG